MKDYGSLLRLFTSRLNAYVESDSSKKPVELYHPESYILKLGAKRVRPLLTLMACDLYSGDPVPALDAAIAVELFHNFSLIHDDIIDSAPVRRNQPSVHVRWGPNTAILAGDVMLVKSFQALESYNDRKFRALSALLSTTAVMVCEGQQMDLNFESSEQVAVQDYIGMITLKTAVLLGCALRMGVICADGGSEDQEGLYEFGKNIGIAFQLLDDMLDAFPDDDQGFGKQKGGDILHNKKTFLLLKAYETGNETDARKLETIMGNNQLPAQKKVDDVIGIYDKLGIREMCRSEADKYTSLAISHLEKANVDVVMKQQLENFAMELLNRKR